METWLIVKWLLRCKVREWYMGGLRVVSMKQTMGVNMCKRHCSNVEKQWVKKEDSRISERG